MRFPSHFGNRRAGAHALCLAFFVFTFAVNGSRILADDRAALVSEADREFWSFRPVTRPGIPSVRQTERVRTAIDQFLLERLEAEGLGFAPDADKRTFIRRVSLDLIGLPPMPEEVARFLADDSPDAYESLVDRLLASPHFGERWARHWLDTAGYVDTVGFDVDADLIIASEGKWRYRDYVVNSFNSDKPYDQFITEQIAGDELVDWRNAPSFTPEIIESLVATGFLRTAADFTHEDVGNIPQNHFGVLHDTLEIVGSSLLGLTLNCSRCHNHKFDPLPQEDYYRLMAVFTPAYNPNEWKIVFPYDKKMEDRALADVSPAERGNIDRHNAAVDQQVEELTRRIDQLQLPAREKLFDGKLEKVPEPERGPVREAIRTPAKQRTDAQKQLAAKYEGSLKVSSEEILPALDDAQKQDIAKIRDEIAQRNKSRQQYGKIQALYDVGEPPVTKNLIGGNYETPGQAVQPGGLRVLSNSVDAPLFQSEARHSGTSGRRLAFAKWLMEPESRAAGLSARVLVSRVWQHLFGTGIVPTTDNFGVGGSPPSHPEMLEWVCAELMDQGWRIKPLIRAMVLSNAYRQSATLPPSTADQADPDNELLGRMRLKRLESESIRDSVLAVGGSIDRRLGGPPIMLEFRPADGMILIAQKQLPYPAAEGRRSIYLLSRRAFPLSDLVVFDQPVVATNCPERNRSAVPLQSLSMLNGALLWQQSERFATRLVEQQPKSREKQIAAAFEAVLAREPSTDETKWSKELLDRQQAVYQRESAAADAVAVERRALVHFCHTLLNTSEFLYVP
ncbi:MAG: DUF1549 and DUF1553 domain-containing protein [Planctomycetaceae bacterium]